MKAMKNLSRCLVSIGAFFALSASSAFAGSESPYGSGGEVTFVGANKDAVHTFTGVGDNSFTLFSEKEVWFLVVGGGGAGGKDCAAGGGGGGFVESNSVVLAAGNYTVTVGAGGLPPPVVCAAATAAIRLFRSAELRLRTPSAAEVVQDGR